MGRHFVDCNSGLILKNKINKLLLFFINNQLDAVHVSMSNICIDYAPGKFKWAILAYQRGFSP